MYSDGILNEEYVLPGYVTLFKGKVCSPRWGMRVSDTLVQIENKLNCVICFFVDITERYLHVVSLFHNMLSASICNALTSLNM